MKSPIITINTGGYSLQGWTDVEIVRSIEQMPSTFRVTCSSQAQILPSQVKVKSGDPCTFYADGDLLLTGYIGKIAKEISPTDHTVGYEGTSKCVDLVNNQAVLKNTFHKNDSTTMGNGQLTGTMNQISNLLCSPFGITVDAQEKTDTNFQTTQYINIGETPYEIIERLSRVAKVLVYDDVNGNLVIDDVGTDSMASGFTCPGNVLNASTVEDQTFRFSDVYTVWQSFNTQANANLSNNKGYQQDSDVGRFKPRFVVSDQNVNGIDIAQARADWEVKRAIGRSQAITVNCDSWRDSSGKLWDVNKLAKINIPAFDLYNVTWLISKVTFKFGALEGTYAIVELMPPDAFQPEPTLLNPAGAEFYSGNG